MKATGIVRDVDEQGRIVIPKSLRKTLDISKGDPIEIFTENDTIILKKYAPFCTFCGSSDTVLSFHGKNVCSECVEKIKFFSK